MLILDELKEDHNRIKTLFEEIVTQDADQRIQALASIKAIWFAHAKSEEAVVYRSFLDDGIASRALLLAMRDHQQIEAAFSRLENIAASSELWLECFHHLRQATEHHMSREEALVMPEAERFVSHEEAEEMAGVFSDLRHEALEELAGRTAH